MNDYSTKLNDFYSFLKPEGVSHYQLAQDMNEKHVVNVIGVKQSMHKMKTRLLASSQAG